MTYVFGGVFWAYIRRGYLMKLMSLKIYLKVRDKFMSGYGRLRSVVTAIQERVMSDSALVIIIITGMWSVVVSVVAIVALFLGRGFQARMTNKHLSVNVPPDDAGVLAPPWYHAEQSARVRLESSNRHDAGDTHRE